MKFAKFKKIRCSFVFNVAFFVASCVLISGCGNFNSIYRNKVSGQTDRVSVVTVDAKQRNIIIAPVQTSGDMVPLGIQSNVVPDNVQNNVAAVRIQNNVATPEIQRLGYNFRICAEAAPDAFSAYASSLSGNFGLGATERNAAFANSISETAATIERTQTVNLLRESMYRTCERYLSGALTEDQFIVQAARDQRSMVAVLAIEQLTGAIKARSTIISGPSTSVAMVSGTEAAKLIDRFRIEEDAAKKNMASAEKAYEDAKKTGKCDSVAEKPADDAKNPTAAEWVICKSAEAMFAQRKDELKNATARLDKALTLAADFVEKQNASTSSGVNSAESNAGIGPKDSALVYVAQAVKDIATSTAFNEPLMFCIAYVQRSKGFDADVKNTCLGILKNQAQVDLNRQAVTPFVVDAKAYNIAAAQGSRFNAFMVALQTQIRMEDPSKLPAKISAFEKMAGTNYGLDKKCVSSVACLTAVRDSDLSESYFADEQKLNSAFLNWDKF